MKKFIFILLLMVTIVNAWRTTIDSSQIRNFFRLYYLPHDQIIFVNASDSTVDTTGIIVEKFGTRDITFPQIISYDSIYGGCYLYVPNSDQSLYISSGKSGYDPDSGAGLIISGENTGSTGDLFLYSGVSGSIDFYGLNNFRFFNGVDTLKFEYNTGDDGFVIESKRLELVGREGVGHGLAIDSFYVAVDDTFLVRNGAVGIGTDDPSTVASFSYGPALPARNVTINDDTRQSVLSIEGNSAKINLIDNAGGTDDKLMQTLVDGGILKYLSLTDVGVTNVDNILTMDLGTGNIGIGTATPRVVASYEYATTVHNVNIYDASNYALLTIQGEPAGINMYDNGASANDGWMRMYVNAGQMVFKSLNDDNTDRVDNIVTFDLGTGYIGIGTAAPEEKLHVIDNIKSSGTVSADSIYGTKIGTNGAVACSLKDGTTLRATGSAKWHKVGKKFSIQLPELSGTVTSGQMTRIYFPTGTIPLPATTNVYQTIWANNGDPLIVCAAIGGNNAIIIGTDASLSDLGSVTLTINEFCFTFLEN